MVTVVIIILMNDANRQVRLVYKLHGIFGSWAKFVILDFSFRFWQVRKAATRDKFVGKSSPNHVSIWFRSNLMIQTSNALLEVAKELSSELELEGVSQKIAEKVQELVDVDRCTLFFVDEETNELVIYRSTSTGSVYVSDIKDIFRIFLTFCSLFSVIPQKCRN